LTLGGPGRLEAAHDEAPVIELESLARQGIDRVIRGCKRAADLLGLLRLRVSASLRSNPEHDGAARSESEATRHLALVAFLPSSVSHLAPRPPAAASALPALAPIPYARRMKPGLKRALKVAALVLFLLVAIPAGLIASAFIGTSAIQDGLELEGVARIVKDGFVDVGVVDLGGGKVALVDAGNDKQARAILAELRRRGLGPDAVAAILLTHGHGDHLAGCGMFPAAPVYALAADVALAEGREASGGPIGRLAGARPTGVKIARGLADGESLVLGNRTVRVFAIPGHTAGSAAYLVDGVLFLGDSAGASSDGKILAAPKLMSADPAENRASLAALAARLRPNAADVKVLVPAHSGVLRGLDPLLAFTPN
jgi:glyoxylase-like metal-dependent hydrolase (beta-lactamase superfamily II)